jgi:ketosteroid isomerase-like protein
MLNRNIFFAVGFALSLLTELALAGNEPALPSAVQKSADSDWEFQQLTLEYLRARSPGNRKFDFEAIHRFYATGGSFSGNGFPLQNLDLVGWERYRDEFAKDMSRFRQLTILPKDEQFKVERHGETVLTRVSFRQVGRLEDGLRVDQNAMVQLEWKKADGLWVIDREQKFAPVDADRTAIAERIVR